MYFLIFAFQHFPISRHTPPRPQKKGEEGRSKKKKRANLHLANRRCAPRPAPLQSPTPRFHSASFVMAQKGRYVPNLISLLVHHHVHCDTEKFMRVLMHMSEVLSKAPAKPVRLRGTRAGGRQGREGALEKTLNKYDFIQRKNAANTVITLTRTTDRFCPRFLV